MLEVLAKHDVPATPFIRGLAAENLLWAYCPDFSKIEVSCHGYEHESISNVCTT